MHQQRMKHWKLLYIFAIGNLIYKALATLASGFTDDLLGTCFLKVGSKKWFWVLNSLELILFGYCLYKIRKYQNKEERMK